MLLYLKEQNTNYTNSLKNKIMLNIAWIKPKFRDLYIEIGNGWQYYTVIADINGVCKIYNDFHKHTIFAKKEHLNF